MMVMQYSQKHFTTQSIIDYDKTATELENLVKKDRSDLDALIKPAEKMKSTDRYKALKENLNLSKKIV